MQRHVLELRDAVRVGGDGDARRERNAESDGGRLRRRQRGVVRAARDRRVVEAGGGGQLQRGAHQPPLAVREQRGLGGDVGLDDGAVSAVPLQLGDTQRAVWLFTGRSAMSVICLKCQSGRFDRFAKDSSLWLHDERRHAEWSIESHCLPYYS